MQGDEAPQEGRDPVAPDVRVYEAARDCSTVTFQDPARRKFRFELRANSSGTTIPEAHRIAARLVTLWNLFRHVADDDLAAGRVVVVCPSVAEATKAYGLAVRALADQVSVPCGPWRFEYDGKDLFVEFKKSEGIDYQHEPLARVVKMLDHAAKCRTTAPALAMGILWMHEDNERLRNVISRRHAGQRKGGA